MYIEFDFEINAHLILQKALASGNGKSPSYLVALFVMILPFLRFAVLIKLTCDRRTGKLTHGTAAYTGRNPATLRSAVPELTIQTKILHPAHCL